MPQTPAGQRDKLVVFQRDAAGRTAMGGIAAGNWQALGSRFAKVLYGSGAERRGAAGEAASQAATFRVLADAVTSTVTVRDRIAFLGRTWDITSAVPIGGPSGAEIEFTAVANMD